MNIAANKSETKSHVGRPNNPSKKPSTFKGKNKPNAKKGAAKPNPNQPPLMFLTLDLTDRSQEAKIIRVNTYTVFANGETEQKEHLFSAADHQISQDAEAYHHLTLDMLKDKPLASTFNFEEAKYIVVWDGQVTRNIFKYNGIKKHSPIINLQSLARYLNDPPKPIKLNDFALQAMPERKNMLEFKLKKPESRASILPAIYAHLKTLYKGIYDEDRDNFMASIGRSLNKKKAQENAKIYLDKKAEFITKNPQRNKPDAETANTNHKKVITVVATTQPAAKPKSKYKPRTTVQKKK